MKKADFIVIAIVLAVVGVLAFFLYYVNGDSGKYVQIESNGEVIETLSIDEDFEKKYNLDGNTNTVHIENGEVTVTQADCKDKICVNHMPIHRTGESIVCLPHKFVVTVLDDGEDAEIDAVA